MLRLEDNPPRAYSAIADADRLDLVDWELDWTPAYTRSRQEKALAWDLRRAKVPYFLPLVERQTSSGGRRRTNLYPLFPSYLFFAGGELERIAALKTNRIVQLLPVDPLQLPRLRQELAALHAALELSPRDIELYSKLAPGAPVKITAGALRGYEAIVLDASNKRKVALNITALGASVVLEIDADLVDPYA